MIVVLTLFNKILCVFLGGGVWVNFLSLFAGVYDAEVEVLDVALVSWDIKSISAYFAVKHLCLFGV